MWLFDNPLMIQLPEKGEKNPSWFWIHDDPLNLIAKNLDWKCWIHFCPNGSRWKVNSEWQKIVRSEKNEVEWWLISCLVFDFDFKDQWERYQDINQMINIINDKCELNKVKPTYIFNSWGWAHVYFMFKKEEIEMISSILWKRVLEVSEYAAKLWNADIQCWATCRLSWTIRVPFSMNNKYNPARPVKLEKVNLDPDDLLDFSKLEVLVNHVESQKETLKRKEWLKMSIWKQADLVKIPMEDILNKLYSYPREMPDWRRQVMTIKGTQVIIYEVKWEAPDKLEVVNTVRWNSYKYNREKNYINCFCMWPVEEAPTGNWFGFVYNYFLKNFSKTESFFQKEYWISINWHSTWAELKKISDSSKWLDIVFTEKCVKFVTGDWENSKVMFDWMIIPKWKWYVRQMKVWESGIDQMAYMFEINWKEQLIVRKSTKKEHNKAYMNMFCYLPDNNLNEFFNTIDICEEIPWINIYEKNGYYDWVVILWWEAIDWDLGTGLISTTYKYDMNHSTSEQITVQEFFDEYLKIYDRSIAIPTFLQSLALWAMNLREWHNTYPWLLVTGLTWSGKSSIMSLMKSMLGYAPSARTFSLPWMTAQPLKQHASDNSILFLEELTNRVSETAEELLRNVVNKDKASRWMLDDNIEFNLHSPLFIVWERALKDESLNNRFVIVVVWRRNWLPDTRQIINELQRKTASIDIYRTRSEQDKDMINKSCSDYSLMISRNDIDSRNADTFAYMFVARDVFNLDITDEELMKLVKMWIKKTWVWQTSTLDDKWVIKSYLVRSVMNSTSNVTVTNNGANIHVEVLFLDDAWYEKAKTALNTAIVNFNDELWYDAFEVNSQWMTCEFKAVIWSSTTGWRHEDCKTICEFWSATFDWMRGNWRCFHYMTDFEI